MVNFLQLIEYTGVRMTKNLLFSALGFVLLSSAAMASANGNHETQNENTIDFTDPTAAYSSVQIGFDNNGLGLATGFAKALDEQWALLAFGEVREDFSYYRARGALMSTTYGTGVMGDYLYQSDSKTSTYMVNALQLLPVNEQFTLAPVAGVGLLHGEYIDNRVPIGMLQLMGTYSFTDVLSVRVTPAYTYGFSDIKTRNNQQALRTFEVTSTLAYRLSGNQNLTLKYQYNNSDENTVGVNFTHAF